MNMTADIVDFYAVKIREVRKLLRECGKIISYATLLCGEEAREEDADVIYEWIKANYPGELASLAQTFMQGVEDARRKIFKTDAGHNLQDDPQTMLWLKMMKMQCPRIKAMKYSLLADFKTFSA